jgi:hypothetical protein
LLIGASVSPVSSEFQCTVHGVPTLDYAVEVSTNLIDWAKSTTQVAPFVFVDANSSAANTRYFRAVYVDSYGGCSSDSELP